MPRKLRIQYPGAMYHVMNRGDQREAIFRDDEDRQKFLATLGEACQKTEWQVHAYCLMSNHCDLVVETPQPKLADGMKWLWGGYTKRFPIARRLRQETTMSLKWVAQRLQMGSWSYVSNLLNARTTSTRGQPVLPLFQ